MSFPRYETYSSSGVPWITRLPTHWRSRRLKTLFRRMQRSVSSEDKIVTAFRDGQVTLRANRREDGFTNALQEVGYQGVREGDLVISAMDAFAGAIGVSENDGKCTPVYSVCRPNDGADARYYALLLRHMALSGFVNALAKGIRERSTEFRWADAGPLNLPCPPLDEQERIIRYLYSETGKIDALVEAQRRLIELLKEKRQAVISHAVTKGLDPTAPMKDSGVEWLGEVPAHWNVTAVKRLCEKVTDGAHISPETEDGVYPFVSTKDVSDKGIDFAGCLRTSAPSYEYLVRTGCRPEMGDVLFSKDGTVGRTVVVREDHPFVVASSLIIIRPRYSELNPEYLHLLCQGACVQRQVESFVKGAGLPRLSIQNLLRVIGVFPPLPEQISVVRSLDPILARYSEMVGECERAIKLLQERRSALISAAVTGKIDVRGVGVVEVPPAKKSVDRVAARTIIGAAVLELVADRADGGRVKAQKLIYLAEAHAGVRELGGHYLRMAAGPFDGGLIEETESQLERASQVAVEQPAGPGGQVLYKIIGPRGRFQDDLDQLLGDRKPTFDKTLLDVATLDTRGAEAVATLYAVWNDMLLDGDDPTDDRIISGFLDDWHPEKRVKFKDADLRIWLGWMRRHDLVPSGQGPRTTTGRLFV